MAPAPPLKKTIVPGPNDVLAGRGGGTNHHEGNKRFRQLVEERKLSYINSERLDKPMVAMEIVHLVKQRGGRFLKFAGDNKYVLLSDRDARRKTSQALREGASTVREQQQQQQDDSSQEEEEEEEKVTQKRSILKTTTRVAAMEAKKKAHQAPSAQMTPVKSSLHYHSQIQKHAIAASVEARSMPPEPRPMKRATSNENESLETKYHLRVANNGSSVKRATLGRDKSFIAKNLREALLRDATNSLKKQQQLPPRLEDCTSQEEEDDDSSVDSSQQDQEQQSEECTTRFDAEMRRLSNTFEQTSLKSSEGGGGFIAPAREFSYTERMNDMDLLYAELEHDVRGGGGQKVYSSG